MPDLRASDADREQSVAALRHHADAGRLTVDELDERIAGALVAKTVGELAALHTDLPALTPQPAPGRAPRLPGTMGFSAEWYSPASLDVTMGELVGHVVPKLQAYGYRLTERDAMRLEFEWSSRPVWTILVAILVFPLGLVALLHKRCERIAIDLVRAGHGTRVLASGVAPLPVRRAFARLEE